jgi:hypothetical protein
MPRASAKNSSRLCGVMSGIQRPVFGQITQSLGEPPAGRWPYRGRRCGRRPRTGRDTRSEASSWCSFPAPLGPRNATTSPRWTLEGNFADKRRKCHRTSRAVGLDHGRVFLVLHYLRRDGWGRENVKMPNDLPQTGVSHKSLRRKPPAGSGVGARQETIGRVEPRHAKTRCGQGTTPAKLASIETALLWSHLSPHDAK